MEESYKSDFLPYNSSVEENFPRLRGLWDFNKPLQQKLFSSGGFGEFSHTFEGDFFFAVPGKTILKYCTKNSWKRFSNNISNAETLHFFFCT